MGIEIERKFLVASDEWRENADQGVRIRQAYLAVGPPTAVRVRLHGDEANINVKTATLAIRRQEFEYAIPLSDAEAILEGCTQGHVIEKTRYEVHHSGMTWEVDVFEGVNAGLIVAEIELEDEDQAFDLPPWAGDEVSGDPRYLNTHLSRTPYSEW